MNEPIDVPEEKKADPTDAWSDAMLALLGATTREPKPKRIGGYAGVSLQLQELDEHHSGRYWKLMERIGQAAFTALDPCIPPELRDAGMACVKAFVADAQRVIEEDHRIRDTYVESMIREQVAADVPDAWIDLERRHLVARQRLREPEFAIRRFRSLLDEASEPNSAAPKDEG